MWAALIGSLIGAGITAILYLGQRRSRQASDAEAFGGTDLHEALSSRRGSV